MKWLHAVLKCRTWELSFLTSPLVRNDEAQALDVLGLRCKQVTQLKFAEEVSEMSAQNERRQD